MLTSERLKQNLLNESEITLSYCIKRLLWHVIMKMGVYCPQQTPSFTSFKKDGTHHMILNLKTLNKIIAQHHLKMDTRWSAVCFM